MIRYIKNSCTLTIDGVLYGYGHSLPSNQHQKIINVNLNGENIEIDIMDINSVAGFLASYDVNYNSEQSLKSNKLYVYNYKLKKVIGLSYTKQIKFEDLLDYAGFTNTETGIACYTKTDYNSYKVKAENSHLNKIGLTRQELISFMKNMNGLDLIFLESILKGVFNSEELTPEEIFIRCSTTVYVYKTNDKQYSTIGDMDVNGLFILDMGLVDEASKILADLGYDSHSTSVFSMSYKSSREGMSFGELLAMDFLQQKEKVEMAVSFAISNLLMTLSQNVKSAKDKALVKVDDAEKPPVVNEGRGSINNINDFINGNKKFDDVLDDYAKIYGDNIKTNKPWSWDDSIPGGDILSARQKKLIKDRSVSLGDIPNINVIKVEGMKFGFADFKNSDLVKKIVQLPEEMWKLSDTEQFKWLDKQIGGHLDGYTWHHSEIPGEMQLVPFGIHNATAHNGGRSIGMWGYGPR